MPNEINREAWARFNTREGRYTVISKLFFDFLLIVCNDYSQRGRDKNREDDTEGGNDETMRAYFDSSFLFLGLSGEVAQFWAYSMTQWSADLSSRQ